ncbi:phosphoadenosine phosphosulfate reductase family protein [Rhizosaccharibacter radicis]|uniref:Phosphoadenosine phosphosulfate reductase family protein n=1 Tax=Rhizosaccharibacter radicis TaxID=2782605 RepID=A0ABT1VY24_9PROT|nr:phosphoadenosine phosphosulfate reductase family protein [Acetobacteraceae bacterium KSS12]
MGDPFLITGPAVISFSGGRTSAYMLWRILQAHGGTLPDDVLVCFANTGREMPATLDFVRDCAAAWNVQVRWLEYRHEPGRHYAVEVSHNSASRNGEPFEAVMLARGFMPNPVTRFCTVEMKIRTLRRFVREERGWKTWLNVVGLRADEPGRVQRAHDPEKQKKDGFVTVCPLALAGVQEWDVLSFWKRQSFDLRLAGPWEGNCDGCFLKNRAALERMHRDHPDRMKWWADIEQEKLGDQLGQKGWRPEMSVFRADREDYATMARIVRDQGSLPFDIKERVIPCVDAGCGV